MGLNDIIILEKTFSRTTEVGVLTPDEICEALVKIGADVSRRTLLNYEEAGLIPTPTRGSHGRKKGRFTDYPPKTIEETFAAWQFVHGKYGEVENSLFVGMTPKLSIQGVKKIRDLYYSGIRSNAEMNQEGITEAYLLRVRTIQKIREQGILKESDDYLSDAALLSVSGMEKVHFAFLDLWEAECLRARALMMIKTVL